MDHVHNPLVAANRPKWSAGTETSGGAPRILPGLLLELLGSRVDSIRHTYSFSSARCTAAHLSQQHSGEFIDISSFGDLVQMLQQLPEKSIIASPPNAQKVRHDTRKRDENVGMSHSTDSVVEAFTEPCADICQADQRYQSRQESLWRTLIHNHLGSCTKAPETHAVSQQVDSVCKDFLLRPWLFKTSLGHACIFIQCACALQRLASEDKQTRCIEEIAV